MDFTPNRPGQVNNAGDATALFYKKFSGEVMLAFQENNVMMPLHMVRTIKSGKSAAFPAHGKASGGYHTPGTELNGRTVAGNEKIISIDSMLVSDTFIANIDEAMNEYDVRSIYSTEAGRFLARESDKRLLQVGCLTAREAATYTNGPTGTSSNAGSTVTTNDTVLAGAIFNGAQAFDENDVPSEDRVAIVRPAQYYLLVEGTTVINRDWGGAGVYADGKVIKVAGLSIIKSNHIPSTNIAAVSGERNTYSGDFTNTVALLLQKRAVGTVKLLDLAVESEYSVRHQGTLVVAKYAMGHGVLRPECAYEIKSAA